MGVTYIDVTDDIRDRYDRIMKGEGVLVDVGACAFSHVIATGIARGLLVDDHDPITPPREIVEVMRLFRRHLRRRNSDETMRFNQVGYALGLSPDDLFFRRCVELPRYFEVLQVHRNKRAHRGEVTVASLCAFAGAVLGVLELAADEWADAKKLNEAAERALEWATNQTSRESTEDAGRLRSELDQREMQLKQLKAELQELKAERSQSGTVSPNGDPEIVRGALKSAKAHITKKVNEAKGEMDLRLEQIGDAIASLRSEVLDAQEHEQPSMGEENDDAATPIGQDRPQLTGGQARRKLVTAFQRMRDTRGVDISVNVFQRWITDEALEWAAAGKMGQIDDWWNLPSVQRKMADEKERMREQLRLPNVEDWMMDIYRRVERRSGAP